jgi:hypothetical protein
MYCHSARLQKCGLLFLLLVLASAARAQSAPPPAGLPPAEAPPAQLGAAPAPGYPPSAYAPPGYPAPGYPPPGHHDPVPNPPVRAPGAETHDGFYLRLQLGVGYTGMSASTKGTDLSVAGGGSTFDLALGAALNSHLIIYGTLIDSVARNPTYKLNGPSLSDNPSGMIAGTVSLGGFGNAGVVGVGGGVATYLPSNLFFAGSLLASRLFVDDFNGNTAAKTDWGFTFRGSSAKSGGSRTTGGSGSPANCCSGR